jgi:hypothetical protein
MTLPGIVNALAGSNATAVLYTPGIFFLNYLFEKCVYYDYTI